MSTYEITVAASPSVTEDTVEVVDHNGESYQIGPDSPVETDDPDVAAYVSERARLAFGNVAINETHEDGEPNATSVTTGARSEDHPDAKAAQQEAADAQATSNDKAAAKASKAADG